MGPPRRPPPNAQNQGTPSRNPHNSNSQRQPKPQRQKSQPSVPPTMPPPVQQPNLGMSPASRYKHNLKVLRRRDPSIISIFDQFSHVCVYHHNGDKWEKHGYEGSMFLYERDSYPPYGFYILNRMGMNDHIQRLYPEDDIGAHGSYLMLRSYPEFTARRLAKVWSVSEERPEKFADAYAIQKPEDLTEAKKGPSQTVGLWMFATDAREPMIDVMMRLHSYIKKNVPYPEEFRYGPNRPPPPNPHLRTTSNSEPSTSDSSDAVPLHQVHRTSSNATVTSLHNDGEAARKSAPEQSQVQTNGGASELDVLFAKLGPTESSSSSTIYASTSHQSHLPDSTSKMTVASLFAALNGSEPGRDSAPPPAVPTPPPALASNRGLALLDTIFASVDNTDVRTALVAGNQLPYPSSSSSTRPPPSQSTSVIYSPKPTASVLPQILTQDVISTLLGLPPSRSVSAAPSASTSSTSNSSRSANSSSHQGDNEDDGEDSSISGASDGDFSESSTVLDPDADPVDQRAEVLHPDDDIPALNLEMLGVGGYMNGGSGRVNGDVTPRPPLRSATPPSTTSPTRARYLSPVMTGAGSSVPIPISALFTSSSSPAVARDTRVPPPANPRAPSTARARALVPFEAESALWPYPRAPLDDRAEVEDGEIVELNFADTRALSDPDAFRRAQEARRGAKKGRRREKERERERAEIERGWDVPGQASAVRLVRPAAPHTPAPAPVPVAAAAAAAVNGHAGPSTVATPVTAKPVAAKAVPRVNGTAVNGGQMDRAVAGASVVDTAVARMPRVAMERKEFVREVLTLIHTDSEFVDELWRNYTARTQ